MGDDNENEVLKNYLFVKLLKIKEMYNKGGFNNILEINNCGLSWRKEEMGKFQVFLRFHLGTGEWWQVNVGDMQNYLTLICSHKIGRRFGKHPETSNFTGKKREKFIQPWKFLKNHKRRENNTIK